MNLAAGEKREIFLPEIHAFKAIFLLQKLNSFVKFCSGEKQLLASKYNAYFAT